MRDQFGRKIEYLRISFTDRCNLRCRYCMPEGIECVPMEQILTPEEFAEVVRCGASLGIKNVRLTGGEPLVRKGLISLMQQIHGIEGIERISMTTNGILLKQHLQGLIDAGLSSVNISLDTLNRERYREITGFDGLATVLSAIDSAYESGIKTKINAVSIDFGEEELISLINLAKDRAIDVRFIEMMPIGLGKTFPVFDHGRLLSKIESLFPEFKRDSKAHGLGPAVYYRIPGFQGSIGLISAIHTKFCDSCNRVRLTSQGFLKTCLCYEDGTDLRGILRSDAPAAEREELLRSAMRDAIHKKPRAHCFENVKDITESAFMNGIGG